MFCLLTDCLMATVCFPGRNAAVCKNPSTLTEVPDVMSEERSHRENTLTDSKQKPVRTKPLSPQDFSASQKPAASVDPGRNPGSDAHTQLCSYRPQQMTTPSQVDVFSVSVRSKSREQYLQRGDPNGVDNQLESQNKPFLVQEAPVRDNKRPDWSMNSCDSDTSFLVPRYSGSGRKVEPVKPFSAASIDLGDFGGLTPDVSDLTVYNEITKKTPHAPASNFPSAKMSSHREPTPGSEAEKQQGFYSRPLFSELRQHQQDSGFDSPFYQHK